MNYRRLGKTGFEVSEVSLGTWQVGGKWGEPFSDQNAERIINGAIDAGVNFIDTADVYGERHSEAAVGRVVRSRSEKVYVATKCGRRISPHVAEGYTPQRLAEFVDESLANTGFETLDLIQLHCPPTAVYDRPEIFELFDKLRTQGKIRNLGVSVEKIEEAKKAIEYPNVASVQIIFNMFRLRPAADFFPLARKSDVGIIVRVPLASGLLSGKISKSTSFAPGDHRNFNRNGEQFDKGETFSGVDFETGLRAVEELKALFFAGGTPGTPSLAQLALRWILMFDAVSCVIPGASRFEQVESNVRTPDLPPLTDEQMEAVGRIYDARIKPLVHHLW